MADTITVVCSNCSHEMRASAKHIGRKGRCPNCTSLVTITAPGGDDLSTITLSGGFRGEAARDASGTEVNHLLAGLIGLAATVLLYIVFYALPDTNYLHKLMTERSKIQHTITLVTCWGLAILALKYLAVLRELRSTERELELIPLEIGMQVTPANVEKFIDHLDRLPRDERDSFLARRLRGALEHFKHRNNVSEVQSSLATQADIEASAVDSGYSLLRVFIWVCPILGFIGTVLGISQGVEELAKALPQDAAATAPAQPGAGGDTGSKLVAGVRLVTKELATAFDTTLLGLVCVVILMFPTEALKKIEYGMLDRVQAFANESLLRRMAEGQQAGPDAAMPEVVRQALDSAFKEHQRWLTQWQAQVAKLGSLIGADFEGHFASCQEKLTAAERVRLDGLTSAIRRVEELFDQKAGGDLKSTLSAAAQLHQALGGNTAALVQVVAKQDDLLGKYSSSDLNGVLRSLSDAVAKLADGRAAPAVAPAAQRSPTVTNTQPEPGAPGFIGRIFGRK